MNETGQHLPRWQTTLGLTVQLSLVLTSGLFSDGCRQSTAGRNDVEEKCVSDMCRLWDLASSLALADNSREPNLMLTATNPPANAVSNRLIRVAELEARFRGSMPVHCPAGGRYADFMLYNGPVCRNGHSIGDLSAFTRRYRLTGPRDREEMLMLLADTEPLRRAAALRWVNRSVDAGLLSDAEGGEAIRAALRSHEVVVQCVAMEEIGFMPALEAQDVAGLQTLAACTNRFLRVKALEALQVIHDRKRVLSLTGHRME
jgi:hypothetical protein